MMADFMASIFGVYQTVNGQANWQYIGGVLIFCIALYSIFRLIGAIFKR